METTKIENGNEVAKVTLGEKLAISEKKKAIVKKAVEKKTDKLNFDFSVIAKKGGKNTIYNYEKICNNLQKKEIANIFIQLGVLSDSQIKNITSHKSTFVESKTKFGEFKTEKKAIRHFKQNLEAQRDNCKDKAILPKLQNNLKMYLDLIS
jgi:hypothetical protein